MNYRTLYCVAIAVAMVLTSTGKPSQPAKPAAGTETRQEQQAAPAPAEPQVATEEPEASPATSTGG